MESRCDTTLVITVPNKNSANNSLLNEFRKELGGKLHRMNLASLVPEPADSSAEWRLQNWGTPTELEEDYIESDVIVAGEYYLRFFSIHTPIVPWVKTVAKIYPELHFELDYFNSVDNFEGGLEVQGDQVFFEKMQSIRVPSAG